MRYLAAIILLLFVSSCQNRDRAEKPRDLIPEDKMVDVLTEISLVHGARSYNKQMLEQTGLKPEEYIWRKFDIDSAQFARSNNYYAHQYQQYQRIYDRVKLRLENLKMRYDSLREQEEKRRDSLSREDTTRAERRIFDRDSILPDTLGRETVPIDFSREDPIPQSQT